MTVYKINKNKFEVELDKIIETCRNDLNDSIDLLSTEHHQAYHDCINIIEKIDIYMTNIEVKEQYRHAGKNVQRFLNEEGLPFFTSKNSSSLKDEEIIDFPEKENKNEDYKKMFV